jgi:hypothetical protein
LIRVAHPSNDGNIPADALNIEIALSFTGNMALSADMVDIRLYGSWSEHFPWKDDAPTMRVNVPRNSARR